MAGPIFCPSPALAGYAMSVDVPLDGIQWKQIGCCICAVCVCVVQLNCVRVQVKVQCMAYCKVGVCCRVY